MFELASQLLAQYWAGYFSFHPHNMPAAPFEGLAEAVVEESKQIESAFTTNAHAANDEKLFSDLHASAVFLCGAMATAIGYCDAANYSLAEVSPSTWQLIQQWSLEDVWVKMQPTIRMVFSDRHQWRNSTDLLQLCEIPSYFVERTGVTFTSEDGTVPFQSVSLGMRGAH